MGLCSNKGFNLTGFDFTEIESWERITSVNLSSIERLWLHKLSHVYANSFQRFNNTDIPDPYLIIKPMDKTELSEKLKSALRSMKVNYNG